MSYITTTRTLRSHSNRSSKKSNQSDTKSTSRSSSKKKKKKTSKQQPSSSSLPDQSIEEEDVFLPLRTESAEENMADILHTQKESVIQVVVPDSCKESEQWIEVFRSLNSTLSTIHQDITELKSFKGTLSSFTPMWKQQVDTAISSNEARLDDHDFRIRLLTNIVIKQEQKIEILEDKLSAAYKREIRPNMIIRSIIEPQNETRDQLMEAVNSFMSETLEIEQEIKIEDVY